MKKYFLFLVGLLQFVSIVSKAQIECSSTFNPQIVQSVDPDRYNRYIQLEQHIANYIASMNGNSGERLINPNSTIIIPVVVHVLHNGEPIGVGNNISDAQVQSQIDVLNEDFRRLNADRVNTPAAFAGVAADPNFEFRLACIDPNGNVTNGIHRVQTNLNTFVVQYNSDNSVNEQGTGIKFTAQGGTDAWATDRYLNIWVCNIAANLNGSQTTGYGQFPFDYATKPNTDGVVVLNWAFGRIGTVRFPVNQGRTATHEVGHWLDLFHIWGDATCGDDHCNDTPQQFAANQSNCPGFPHPSNCPNNGANGDMFMNYMDYTVDGCKNIYTQDQTNRTRAVFAQGGPRAAFINNYFRINENSANVVCVNNTTTVTVINPMCLPVTWSVSGAAIIVSGQGTNTITLQGQYNGTATVTATADGYTDSRNIVVGTGINDPLFEQKTVLCPGGNNQYMIAARVTETPGATSYNWYIDGVLKTTSGSNSASVPGGNADGRVHTLQARIQTPCGQISTALPEGRFTARCGSGGGFMFTASPNPTYSTMTVQVVDEKGELSTDPKEKFYELQITDKLGAVKKQFKYADGLQQTNINLSTLPADLYFLQLWDGKTWSSLQIIKN